MKLAELSNAECGEQKRKDRERDRESEGDDMKSIQPTNINSVRVTFSPDDRLRHAPIELSAGCSWADLTIDGAESLIAELQSAISKAKAAMSADGAK